jgi:phosphoribosylformylglycinamidine synthase
LLDGTYQPQPVRRVSLSKPNGDERAAGHPDTPPRSPLGITGLTNADGRVTILMPRPRALLPAPTILWLPRDWPHEDAPWFRLFQKARRWVG